MDKQWFNKSIEEVKEQLKVGNQGLSDEQVKEKREIYGLNELQAQKKKSLIVKFLEQFKDFMIIILIIAAVISGAVGYYQGEGITDSIIILIVVIVNAIIGVAQESKAEKSLEALQKLSSHVTKVIRNGKVDVIPSKELVPGDIVILDTDYIYREDAEKIWWPGGNSYSEYFEKQWQQEKQQEIANNYNNKGEMESEKSKRKDEEHSK